MEDWLDTYSSMPGVRLNMIVSGEGAFVDETGSSRGLSNELDRRLIGHLRRLSDVVVTGGNTARVEKYRVPSQCSLAVISSVFELPDDRFLRLSNPETAVSELKEYGFDRILLETGPTLSKYFLETDQVDEFCLTMVGGDVTVAENAVVTFSTDLHLSAAKEIDGTLFTRWRRGNR